MQRSLLQTIGSFVFDQQRKPVARVRDLVLKPENGKILGFLISFRHEKVLTPEDILYWDENIYIHDTGVMDDIEDIIPVQKALNSGIKIFKNQVLTEEGEKLGHVVNCFFNTKTFELEAIAIAKIFFGYHTKKRLLKSTEIIEVTKRAVIVKSPMRPMRVKKLGIEPFAAG